jgi:hypothetical protein
MFISASEFVCFFIFFFFSYQDNLFLSTLILRIFVFSTLMYIQHGGIFVFRYMKLWRPLISWRQIVNSSWVLPRIHKNSSTTGLSHKPGTSRFVGLFSFFFFSRFEHFFGHISIVGLCKQFLLLLTIITYFMAFINYKSHMISESVIREKLPLNSMF